MKISDSTRIADDVWQSLDEDQRLKVQLVASLVRDAFDGGDWPLAKQNWEQAELNNEERIACWNYFGSRERAYLKDDERNYLQDE